jgi:hypothetical protein
MHKLHVNKLTAIAAISGALLFLVGTFLHPMEADPNVPLAAFTKYAADLNWIAQSFDATHRHGIDGSRTGTPVPKNGRRLS